MLTALSVAKDRSIFAVDPTTGAFGDQLKENTPTGPIPAPLFIGQRLADTLVQPSMQQGYVTRLCASGQPLEYRTYEDKDHLGVVADDSPLITDLIAWTNARIAHNSATPTCNQ